MAPIPWLSKGWVLLLTFSSLLWAVVAQDACPGAPHFPDTASNCNAWHTIVGGDTCFGLEQQFGITSQQFLAWNPSVSSDCQTNFWAGEAYCVGVGTSKCTTDISSSSKTSTTVTSSTSTPTTTSGTVTSGTVTSVATTGNATYSTRVPITNYNLTKTTIETAWPPARTQSGQPSYCNSWHLVGAGETCQSIAAASATTQDKFLAWNPALGSNCTNLFVGWWVCVGVQSQQSSSLVWTTTSSANATVPSPTAWMPSAYPIINSSFVPTPIQTGVPQDCQAFYQAQAGDTCNKVLAVYNYITEAQFMMWNPALAGNCNGLWSGYWYCVADFGTAPPLPPVVTTTPSPIGTGSPSNCADWYNATLGDNCDTVVAQFGTFSKSDFISWNPSVWSDCSNFQIGQYYCVALPGTPTTRTAPVSTSQPTALPTQSGMVSNCTNLWLVSSSDTCNSVATANGITLDNLVAWNPALRSNSTCQLTPDRYVCVSVTGPAPTTANGGGSGPTTAPTSPTSTSSTSTTTSQGGGAVQTPSPVQPGMVQGCVRFYYVESGDGCWAIANAAGISLDTFYSWNPGVGSDCSAMWLNSYCCIGISGPATTITSGPPVPAPT